MTLAGNWGASAEERARTLPCDQLLPDASLRVHRAISVEAPVSLLFLWLCQLKLAPYSYDLLDNFGRRSPQQLRGGLDRLEVGQRFMTIFALASFRRDAHITLRSRRVAVTYAAFAQGNVSRLLVRVVFDPPGARVGAAVLGSATRARACFARARVVRPPFPSRFTQPATPVLGSSLCVFCGS